MRKLDFISLMPSNSSKVEKALERAMFRGSNLEAEIDNIWDPDKCDATLLPYLALSLGVELWNSKWEEPYKRQMIKKYVYIRKIRGTFEALKVAFDALGVNIMIREWFEERPPLPGGRGDDERKRPFFFEINLLASRNQWMLTEEAAKQIRAITDRLKPLRAEYDLNLIFNYHGTMAMAVVGRVVKIARFVVNDNV